MDKLFLAVLNMSLTGAFVITAICLARQLLKKAPKIISYCLWAVVGFRLMFPFSIESIFSLIPFNAQAIPAFIKMQPIPRVENNILLVNGSSALPTVVTKYSANPLQTIITVSAFLWFIGVAGMFLYGIGSYIILKKQMKKSIHMDANIYKADNIKTPFVLGIFSPKIYLPVDLSEYEQGYILLHEKTHIRRHDHIVKFAAYFILCLHWFNPFAWIAFFLMGADMEMSCDERVIKEFGKDIGSDYSMSLVRIATGRRIPCSSPLAFGEGGMKERIKRVLNFKKPSRVVITAAIVVATVLSVGFAMNRVTDGPVIKKQMYEYYLTNDMRLVWDDNDYFVTLIESAGHGKEIKHTSSEQNTWRIYELMGYGIDYLDVIESEGAYAVISLYPPDEPWQQYFDEYVPKNQIMERLLYVVLYTDGTAKLSTPQFSSYSLEQPYYYTFTDSQLLIHNENTIVIDIEPYSLIDFIHDDKAIRASVDYSIRVNELPENTFSCTIQRIKVTNLNSEEKNTRREYAFLAIKDGELLDLGIWVP